MAGEIPKSIKASLYIDGKPAEASLKSVKQVTRTLERDLEKLTIGTDAWNKKMAELSANKKYLSSVRDEVNGVSGAFGRLQAELGKFGTLAVGYLGFQFISSQFQNIIAGNAKLSDSLADIRRVAGLTEQGVIALDKSLGQLDTRTSKSDLRGMAVIAGKLGVAKAEILSFVEATDKLTVALGDELGNADQITTQLGKILNVFEGEVTGQNITSLGNAMVKLANDGVASAGFIADFTQRVSGIAKTAGLSLPATMALGAGIEELGGRSESAATAMQSLLISIAKDTPAAAKVAGVSLADFNKLMSQAPQEALLKYTRGLVANKGAFSEVTQSLKDAGEEGARTIEVITKLGQNTEFFTGKIKDASAAILENGEINDAYALKNQTLGAQVDKLGKDFNKLSTNQTLVNFLTKLVFLAADSVKWLSENSKTIASFTKAILTGAAAWLAYKSALMITGTWTVLVSGYQAVARTGALLLALANAKLTGDTMRAAAAQRMLNLSMAANPIGAVLAIIAALGTAYLLFSQKMETAAKIQQSLNDIQASAKKSALEEKDRLVALNKMRIDEHSSYQDKIKAINKIRELYPSILQGLSDEESLTKKGTLALQDYIKMLDRRTTAEAAQSAILKLKQRNIEIGAGAVVDTSIWQDTKDFFSAGTYKGFQKNKEKTGRANAAIEKGQNDATIAEVQNMYGGVMAQELISTPTAANNGLGGAPLDKKAISEAKRLADQAIKDLESLDAERKKLRLQRLNDQLSDNEKEVKQEADKYDTLIAKEKAFLLQKGVTPEQKKATQKNITGLEAEKETAVTALRIRQEEEMVQKILDLRTQLSGVYQAELVKEKNQINKFYDEQERKVAGNENAISKLKVERFTELNAAEIREKERLEKAKADIEAKYDTVAGTRAENKLGIIQKKYDDEILALKEKFSKELQLTEEFRTAEAAINRNRKAETDALKAKQVEEEREFQIEITQQLSDATFNVIAGNQRAKLDATLSDLEKQRDAELSAKNLTEKQKDAINEKYTKKANEEKLKAWEAERDASAVQAVINGALAVTKAMSQTGVLAPFVIPGIVAATAIQVGTIMLQKPPQYAAGGFSDEDPAGYVSQSTIFNRSATGRPFEAGEAGKEWIAPNWMLENPRTANIIGTLEMVRKQGRSFATGGFTDDGKTSSSNVTASYDFSRLEGFMVKMIEAQNRANDKKIALVYSEFDLFRKNIEQTVAMQTG